MSSNKHRTTQLEGSSLSYMRDELGISNTCPRVKRKSGMQERCQGNLVDVYVRYEPRGPVLKEQECSYCGKVVRTQRQQQYLSDLRDRKRKAWEERKRRRNNAHQR